MKRYPLNHNKDTKSLYFLINNKSRLKVQKITTERSRIGITDTSGQIVSKGLNSCTRIMLYCFSYLHIGPLAIPQCRFPGPGIGIVLKYECVGQSLECSLLIHHMNLIRFKMTYNRFYIPHC